VVSAQAALLLLNRRTDYFPRLLSILVYPTAFAAPRLEHRADGTVLEGREDLLGESWEHGTLVLAWDEVLRGAAHPGDGFNLVIHEFAHQLDSEWGHLEGAPGMGCPRKLAAWARVFRREYDRLVEQVEQGRRTFLDEYGATHPAEFFAVAVEAFFEQPLELEVNHPELHEQLKGFFHQDPGRRFQQEERPV